MLANVDGANLGALNATLVSQRTHDSACSHTGGTANVQLVVDHALVVVRALSLAAAAVRIVVGEGAGVARDVLFLIQEERATLLGDNSQCSRNVLSGGVVLVLVVLDNLAEEAQVLRLDGLGNLLCEALLTGLVHCLCGGHVHRLDLLAGCLLDLTQHVLLTRGDEEDCGTFATCTAGTTDAVHVGLGVVGDVVVNNQGDALNVQAACRHVGCHEDVDATVTQGVNGALTQLLGDVTVNRCCRETACLQLVGDFLGFLLGAHEDNDAVIVFDLEHAGHCVQLVGVHDLHVALSNVCAGGGLSLDANLAGVVQVLLSDLADRVGHGCGEERDLLGVGGAFEDLFHVFGEAHAQHFVCFIQHQVLQVGQVQGALFQVVNHAAGGTDDDLRTAAQTSQLRAVGGATVDGQDGEVLHVGCVGGEGFCNLQSQLAGGCQDQNLGVAGDAVDVSKFSHAGQCRQRECCSLTGTGLCQTDHIVAFEQQRDGLFLDGGRLLVAYLFQSCQDASVQAQVGEAYAFFFSLVGGFFCGGFYSSFCGGFFCFYSRALNGVLGDVLSGHNGLCLGVQFGRGSSILSQFFLYTVGVEAHAFRRLPGVPFTAQPHIIPWGVERPGVLRYRRILQRCSADAAGSGFCWGWS